jgi:FG-GAP repeat
VNPRTKKLAILAGALVLTLGTAGMAAASDSPGPSGPTMPRASAERTMPHVEIGVPGENVAGEADAGLVEVRYSSGTTKALKAPNPVAGDRFGTAIAGTDLNLDFREDLFVGAPGRDVRGKADAGAVYVFLGTPNGLTYWRTITMDSAGIEGSAQAGAGFGSSLASDEGLTDFTNLPVGVPGYDVGTARNAGAAIELVLAYGDQPDWTGTLLTEADWPDQAPETNDRFGSTVAKSGGSDYVIGAPGETVNGHAGAGAVFGGHTWSAPERFVLSQDSSQMPDAAEPGDQFGRVLRMTPERIYVGVPGEDVGELTNAGMVGTAVLPVDFGEPVTAGPAFTQDSTDETTGLPVAGSAEAGDKFGAALTHHGPQSDRVDELDLHIYVGVPGEDVGQRPNAGMVNVLHDPVQPGLTESTVGGTNESGDRFGAALYARIGWTDAATTNCVLIGTPGENAGAGGVRIRLPELGSWKQLVGAQEPGDHYGASINGSL